MRIKTVQWNIGGGKIRDKGSDPTAPASYIHEGLSYVVEKLRASGADIITLQETHADDNGNQAEEISKALGFKYSVNDVYASSHLEDGKGLGQGIISRYPIKDHQSILFLNPRYELIWPNGEKWITHDKGVTSCKMDLGDGLEMGVKTLHLIPFRKYGVDPLSQEAKEVREDINAKLMPLGDICLVQGDFNFNEPSLLQLVPAIFQDGADELRQEEPTTTKGRRYDHVAYKGMRCLSSQVVSDVLTDHYLIVSEFDI